MVAFILTLVYLLINLNKIAASKVSFQTYHGLELPLNLYNHISIIHNDNIYIIGGITNNNEPSTAIYKSQLDVPYVENRDRFVQIDTINIPLPNSPSKINQITCPNKCFTIINNITYIFIDHQETSILLKYDLESETFVNLNTYNYFYNSTQFFNGCITNDNNNIIYSIGTTYSHSKDTTRIGITYNINKDKWAIIYANINNYQKHSMGCSIDSTNENVYLFGATENSLKLNTIDKYTISSEQMITLSDTLQYTQSSLTVTSIDGNYFIIYNGFNGIIEYFDGNAETILTYNETENDNLLFDVTALKLDITNFASFMINNILFVNGGHSISDTNRLHKEIKYVNTLDIFDTYIDQNTDKMACATIYEPHWANLSINAYFIDAYIWNSNSQILFNAIPGEGAKSPGTISNQRNFSRPVVTVLSKAGQHALEYNFTNNSLEALHLMAAYLRSGSGTLVPAVKNTIYNAPYDSVMWASWNDKKRCDNGKAYFRGGVGSVFDKFGTKYHTKYCFEPYDIINAYFFDYNEVSDTQWEFYHNKCRLNIDMFVERNSTNDRNNKTFSIGDYISVSQILYQANKTNVPIYMVSNDILNINHTIYINELENNTCIICDTSQQNYSCVDCGRGIQILDLRTYDINHNEYIIDVFTDNNSDLFDGETEFEFKRNVVKVGIKFHDMYGDEINFTNGIYPEMEMYMQYQIMSDIIPQYESNVIIEYDEAFGLGNDNNMQFMHLEFINNTCSFIIDDNSTVNCSYPIKIPLNMTYKPIKENKYLFNVYSDDTDLKTNVPSSIQRKVQNITVIFPDSVALRDYLEVDIEVMDDVIYQPNSTVRVISPTLQIDATIEIEYVFPSEIKIGDNDNDNDNDNNDSDDNDNKDNEFNGNANGNGNDYSDEYIQKCIVINHNDNDKNETCETGIGPIMVKSSPANDKLKDKIILLSPDTYLANADVDVPRVEGHIAEYNHWIAATDTDNIITSICPEEYCCQEPEGCVYFADEEQLTIDNALCAENRNHSIPLCGSCNHNYTKVFNSANCKQCDTDNWAYLTYPLLVAFVVVFMVILFDRNITDDASDTNQQSEIEIKDNYKKLNQQDEMEGVLIMLFKVFILFYQTINYILWQAGYKFWGTTMIQILSLDSYIWFWIFHSYPGTNGVCFLKEITEMQYHGWYLFFPGCLMFAMIVYALLFNVICKHFAMCTLCNFGGHAVFTVVFIAIFPVLVVLFIVLSCQDLDEYGTVHFFAGDTKCFDIYFIIAAIAITGVILIMMGICLFLNGMTNTSRKKNEYSLYGLVRPYTHNYWYWEFALFIRRLLIIACITLQYFDKMAMHITLSAILFLFVIIEVICCPFKYKAALYMDVICTIGVILCLIIMIVNIDNNFYHDTAIKNSIIATQTSLGDVNALNMSDMSSHQSATFIALSIIIVGPAIFSIWFIIQSIRSCNSDGRRNTQDNRTPLSGENPSEGDSDTDTEETWGGSTQYKNRDNTLSAILETEYEDSKTRKTNSLSFFRKKSKQKDGYEQINNAQALGNKNNSDEDSDSDSSLSKSDISDEKATQGNVTEMAIKAPFIRKTKLQKLAVIDEKPEKKDAEPSGSIDTNQNLFAVDLGKEQNDCIGVSPMNDVIIIGNEKDKGGQHGQHGISPNSGDASFQYTATSNDDFLSNEDSTTDVSDRLDPQKIPDNMEVISKDGVVHTSAMKHLMQDSTDSDSEDTKQTHSKTMPLNPLNAADRNEKPVIHSDSDEHESDLDNLVCEVLDEKTPLNQQLQAPPMLSKAATNISMMSSHLSSEPEILKAKKSHLIYPHSDDEWKDRYEYHEQHMTEEQKRELLKQSTFENVDNNNDNEEFRRNRNMTSPAFPGGDLGHKEFSVHSQHKTTAVVGVQSLDKNKKQIVKDEMSYSDASGTSTNGDEDSSTYETSYDSEAERKSWELYQGNLRKLFSYFAGYQRWNKKKGVDMSRNEVKRFLDIIELTEYWSADKVFKKMDIDDTKRVKLDEFIQYFCDQQFNEKASDLKRYIQKQASWQLLLKSMDIFEKVDTDQSGQLNRKEFGKFGEMLNLDEKETDALWKTIDSDKSGQITIVEMFEWFKKRLEQAKQRQKHGNNDDSSSQFTSHGSFSIEDDDDDDDDDSESGSNSNTQQDNDDEKKEDTENQANTSDQVNKQENSKNKKDARLSYSSDHGSITPFSPNKKSLNKSEDNNANTGK